MNIAFIGHVDHGKSTLIGRLLYDTNSIPKEKIEEIKRTCKELGLEFEFAFVCDALEEERKNRMTIESAYTFFKSGKREYQIIDAPGHKEFLKNMITGVSQADLAILIVDVKEGVKQQTKRHAYLLKLLGIQNVIVVINKMDLVNFKKEHFEKVKKEILEYLEKIDIKPISVIPISAYYGDNVVKKSERMNWYKGKTLLEELNSFELKQEFSDLRLIIQDFYQKNSEKIYFAILISGSLEKNETVYSYPKGEKIKIIKIFDGENEVEKINAKKSIGIVVDKEIERGNVLVKQTKPLIKNEIVCPIFCIIDKIEEGKEYVLKCFTQETKCKIEKIIEKIDVETLEKTKDNKIDESEIGIVKIKFENPIVLEPFYKVKELGRFVILKNGKIVAGGIFDSNIRV